MFSRVLPVVWFCAALSGVTHIIGPRSTIRQNKLAHQLPNVPTNP
jgi:hypothetical protein